MTDAVLTHQPCADCGSSDALAVYDDHTHCYSCGAHRWDASAAPRAQQQAKPKGLLDGVYYASIPERGLTGETCRKYRYGLFDGQHATVHVAEYRDQAGQVCAQHVRTPDKQFPWHGDSKRVQLFGQHLFEPREGGKVGLTICEGEIDCLTYAQVSGLKWPVVSLPNGAQSAERAIRDNINWLSRWPHIELMFDNDEPGRAAAEKCARLLPRGKVKIVTLPLKDASEMHMAGRDEELIKARFDAKTWRPQSIISGGTLLARLKTKRPRGTPFPWLPTLNEWTFGFGQEPMLILLIAGTGAGKTSVMRSLEHALLKQGKRIGILHMEESVERAALGVIGYELGRLLHHLEEPYLVPGFDEAAAACGISEDDDACLVDEHFGSDQIDVLVEKVRDYALSEQCSVIFVDHLSMVTSGTSDNERAAIDELMRKLRPLVQELKITIFAAAHLRRLDSDRGHEDGQEVRLAHIRGSQSIAQNCDMIIGFERDQQNDNKEDANTIRVRLLKNRHGTGDVGLVGELIYDRETGRVSDKDEHGTFTPFEGRGEDAPNL
jgi:twinkle protein